MPTTAIWGLVTVAADPPASPVSVDLGSIEGRAVLLDGWSGDEGFDDAGRFTSFVWAVVFGALIWILLLGVGVSNATAFLSAVVAAVGIFFYVRLFGADPLRR